MYTVQKAVAHSSATGQTLIAKIDITNAFDAIDLVTVRAAAAEYVGESIAQRLIWEHWKGRLHSVWFQARQRSHIRSYRGVDQGAEISQNLCPCTMEHEAWRRGTTIAEE